MRPAPAHPKAGASITPLGYCLAAGYAVYVWAMEPDAIIGLSVTAAALIVLTLLVLWSRRRIEHISRNGFGTPRQIEKDRRNGA